MDIHLLELTYILKEKINSDPRMIKLEKLDKEISSDENIMSLAYKKDIASTRYSDLLKIYSDDSPEVEEARKALFLAKKNLDNYPLIKEYYLAYKEVKKLLDDINNILFKDIKY